MLTEKGEVRDTGTEKSLVKQGAMGILNRLDRCLLPCSHPQEQQALAEVPRERSNLPIQGFAVRLKTAPWVFTKVMKQVLKGHVDPPLPRRLARPHGLKIHGAETSSGIDRSL